MQKIAVSFTSESLKEKAQKLAQHLHLPLIDSHTRDYPLILRVTEVRVELHQSNTRMHPVYVDFLAGKLAHRRLYGGGRGQLIARAIGLRKHPHLTVLDVAAGLGGDAFVLATLGCRVTMVERNPIIASLLKDGLERARMHEEFQKLHLNLVEEESLHYLSRVKIAPDAIYFDPMYPDRTKTAEVKKEMRCLRQIVGTDTDAPTILAKALLTARYRVVVKRPKKALPIEGRRPDLVYSGKSTRFDVYLVSSCK